MKRYFILLIISVFCAISFAQNIGVSPVPQQIEMKQGVFCWDSLSLFVDPSYDNPAIFYQQYEELTDFKPAVVKRKPSTKRVIWLQKVNELSVPMNEEQAYSIEISPDRIDVRATTDQGLFYGWQTVLQLYRYHYRLYYSYFEKVRIPCMNILDYPALTWRGWMDDISRGPIPTMDFMKKQIATLAEFKLNCFSLYTEHTFRSGQFDFAPADGISAEELRELQEFAKPYHVEIIGNQQCFAHLDKILTQPKYARLADSKYNLNPAIPETYDFLDKLLREESQAYDSPFFNINCDETEALGTGAAADYVKKVGAAEAYTRHITKVYDILKKYGKKSMMWADIVLKDNKIIKSLPKDITMMVWSYVPSDDFTGMIKPVKEAGFDFWVVPGVSMWSTVFPDMASYEKNIANFARDGAQNGARGLLNTAWNDSGEAFLHSAWHAFGWGAEMSWHPIVNQGVNAADTERAHRLSVFDTCFNFQFFHFYDNENIIADFVRTVSTYSESVVPEIYNTGQLWTFQPLQFLAANMTEDRLLDVRQERFDLFRTIQWENLILSEAEQYQNPEIIFCAHQAASRMLADTKLRRFQHYLYDYDSDFSSVTSEDIVNTEADIQDLTEMLSQMRNAYDTLWTRQYRPYSREIIDQKYDALIQRLSETRQHAIIRTSLDEQEDCIILTIKTILGGYQIYYTLDGSQPTTASPVYTQPLKITQTCLVRTLVVDETGREIYDSKEVLAHKGIGSCTNVSGKCSTYRPEYSGSGWRTLSDGEFGSESYRDGKWRGYQDEDVVLSYYFSSTPTTEVNTIKVRYLQNFYDWILAPQDVIVSYGDGLHKEELLLPAFHFDVEQVSGNRIGVLELKDLGIRCGTLTVRIKNPGPLPAPHGAAGSPSFIFLDEVVIE